jgi:hypothetical protein
MAASEEIKIGNEITPTQEFNGKTYFLYKGEQYFSKGNNRLHTDVWKYYKGDIQKGYHVHHINSNTTDNRIENLSLVKAELHLRYTGKKRWENNKEWSKEFHKKGIEAAKDWHKSEAGRKWHSEHGKTTWINREYKILACQECGNEYQTRHPRVSKYCHQNCKARALRKRRNGL